MTGLGKVRPHQTQNEGLVFEKSSPGKRAYKLPPLHDINTVSKCCPLRLQIVAQGARGLRRSRVEVYGPGSPPPVEAEGEAEDVRVELFIRVVRVAFLVLVAEPESHVARERPLVVEL